MTENKVFLASAHITASKPPDKSLACVTGTIGVNNSQHRDKYHHRLGTSLRIDDLEIIIHEMKNKWAGCQDVLLDCNVKSNK